MKVNVGWSGEIEDGEWRKHDVTLENDDWEEFAHEHLLGECTTARKYLIMENEATLMLCQWMHRVGGERFKESALEQARECVARRKKLLGTEDTKDG